MAKYLDNVGLSTLWSLIKAADTKNYNALNSAISTEVTDRAAAVATLTSNLATEVSRATAAEATKVDKVDGKGLSANDFTDELLAKLNGIEENAKNVTKVSQLENDKNYQTLTEVNTAIENVVAAAPEALDTLKELADALGNDADFATTITNKITDLKTTVESEISDVSNDLTAEVTRAKAAESTNATNISTLTTKLNSEISRAKAAEEANAKNIATNTTNISTNATNIATNASDIDTLEINLAAEITRAKEAEASLQASLDAMVAITDEEIEEICV